jgi:hypothetical protein
MDITYIPMGLASSIWLSCSTGAAAASVVALSITKEAASASRHWGMLWLLTANGHLQYRSGSAVHGLGFHRVLVNWHCV